MKGETSKYPGYFVRREFGDCSVIIVGGRGLVFRVGGYNFQKQLKVGATLFCDGKNGACQCDTLVYLHNDPVHKLEMHLQ